jgi:hypothetical protein
MNTFDKTNHMSILDINLKIAIADQLCVMDTELEDGTPLQEKIAALAYANTTVKANQPVPEAIEFIRNLDLAPWYDKITFLCFDAGNEIYSYVFRHWDGEDDLADIRSFEGIEALTKLETIDLFTLCPPETDLNPLLTLKSLKKFSCYESNYAVAENKRVIDQFKTNGVEVKLY